MTDEHLQQAVQNNALWCDLVCRAHGIPTQWGDGLWLARRRAPRFYPDAVTLSPGVSADELLARIDRGPGASVKDSFADLPLAEYGFDLLFGADWIAGEARGEAPGEAPRDPPRAARPNTGRDWSRVATESELVEWIEACGLTGVLPPPLALDPDVRFLAGRERGQLRAGAITHRTGSVVGVSNVFGDRPWPDVPAAANLVFPGARLVGYEHGPQLAAALAAGFETLGPLRIWLRGTAPSP